jgi:hypothetical protein
MGLPYADMGPSTSSSRDAATKRSAHASSSGTSAASMRATTADGSSPNRSRSCLRSCALRSGACPSGRLRRPAGVARRAGVAAVDAHGDVEEHGLPRGDLDDALLVRRARVAEPVLGAYSRAVTAGRAT